MNDEQNPDLAAGDGRRQQARDEASLLQDYLRGLQHGSLPAIAAVLLGVAAAAFSGCTLIRAKSGTGTSLACLVCLVALGAWLLATTIRWAHGFWPQGSRFMIAVACWLSGTSAILLLLALPCIMVTSYVGTLEGVSLGAFVSLVVFLQAVLPQFALGGDIAVIALAAIWGSIGLVWAALRPLRTATAESLYHFTLARQLLEESRDRQQELNQAYEELRNAYKELGRLNQVLLATQPAADEARQAKEWFLSPM